MPTKKTSHARNKFNLVTLKLSKKIAGEEYQNMLFQDRHYCDAIIDSLIHCIDHNMFTLYGFVFLADQIHLIMTGDEDRFCDRIEYLKMKSAGEVFRVMAKRLNPSEENQDRDRQMERKIFNTYLNSDESVLWEQHTNPIVLNISNQDIGAISNDLLISSLNNTKGNYLQLGAAAFTHVMLDSLKIN